MRRAGREQDEWRRVGRRVAALRRGELRVALEAGKKAIICIYFLCFRWRKGWGGLAELGKGEERNQRVVERHQRVREREREAGNMLGNLIRLSAPQ